MRIIPVADYYGAVFVQQGLAGTSATPAASAATIAATTSRLSTPRVRPTSEAPGRRVGTTPSSLARRTQSLGKVGGVFCWVSLLPIPASLVLGLHSRFGDK